MKNVSVAV